MRECVCVCVCVASVAAGQSSQQMAGVHDLTGFRRAHAAWKLSALERCVQPVLHGLLGNHLSALSHCFTLQVGFFLVSPVGVAHNINNLINQLIRIFSYVLAIAVVFS